MPIDIIGLITKRPKKQAFDRVVAQASAETARADRENTRADAEAARAVAAERRAVAAERRADDEAARADAAERRADDEARRRRELEDFSPLSFWVLGPQAGPFSMDSFALIVYHFDRPMLLFTPIRAQNSDRYQLRKRQDAEDAPLDIADLVPDRPRRDFIGRTSKAWYRIASDVKDATWADTAGGYHVWMRKLFRGTPELMSGWERWCGERGLAP